MDVKRQGYEDVNWTVRPEDRRTILKWMLRNKVIRM
jgi:hypothetical protein